jgi:hypothetical protein
MTRAFLLALAFVLVSLAGLTQASASCTVSRNCSGNPTVSCSGNVCTSGSSGTGWVECDGTRLNCIPDCSLDGFCNPYCPYYGQADLDCPCANDDYCNPACGVAQDFDCCPEGAFCKSSSQCGPWGGCSNQACVCL